MRLQKVLAEAGLGSRRACEQLILDGRVEVDGNIVTELGTRIDPETQAVYVDTLRISTSPQKVYLALNKPAGVVSTMKDPEGRKNLSDYVGNRAERIFHVGRLDTDTEGLILLTNDGELSNRLAHPRYEIPKTYLAQVK
ncbi:rRNA pseudouridine synthase, partial [Geobacillus sp. MMMUD3]|nr:rRNA pseudouridine synthase [Geobacillus sp. MMMUD3]